MISPRIDFPFALQRKNDRRNLHLDTACNVTFKCKDRYYRCSNFETTFELQRKNDRQDVNRTIMKPVQDVSTKARI